MRILEEKTPGEGREDPNPLWSGPDWNSHLRTLVNRATKMNFEKWASGVRAIGPLTANCLLPTSAQPHVYIYSPGKLFFASDREKRFETSRAQHSSIRCRE